jgi:hypothetical protein
VPRILVLLLWILALATAPCVAQELRVEGEVDQPAVTLLREIAARGSYVVLTRDTLLPTGTRISGDLVIAADVRLEGAVAGNVAVLPGGDFFLRPGASVDGSAATLGGGLFLSANARVGRRIELPAYVGTRLEYRGGAFVVHLTPPEAPPIFETGGVMGFGLPTYDRVNGVTLRATGLARLYADTAAPALSATALYYTARETYGIEASLLFRLGTRHHLAFEAARHTATNDAWIRADVANSLAALSLRSDIRNYFAEEMVAVEVAREAPIGQGAGDGFVAPRLRVSASRAESLPARDVWTQFGDEEWRENPAIDPGVIVSGVAGALAGWRGATTAFTGDATVEWAPPGAGDFDFALLTLDGRWDMTALWSHTISVRGHFLHPLGTSAPRQRWSLLGGPGTLPTLEAGQLRGDHLVFVESSYTVPLPWIVLPLAGSPAFVARHALGSAWSSGGRTPDFHQNLGAGLAFPFLRVELFLDPADRDRLVPSVTVSLPI